MMGGSPKCSSISLKKFSDEAQVIKICGNLENLRKTLLQFAGGICSFLTSVVTDGWMGDGWMDGCWMDGWVMGDGNEKCSSILLKIVSDEFHLI